MHKVITISALTVILSLPAFAEISNNATCNTTNLGQSNNNSTANVEANWNANTININWYNGDTRILQNTCTYDGGITLPTQPTKPGYTFSGWRLRAAPVAPNCSAINSESTCNNTNGCVWRVNVDYTSGAPLYKCYNEIPFSSVPYSHCSDITNQATCEEYGQFGCNWSNSCYFINTSSERFIVPKEEWCEGDGLYFHCSFESTDNSCYCWYDD